jgi:hypothetical protein
MQLASIEGATLLAPEGLRDDRADSYALAHVGRLAMANQVPAVQVIRKAHNLFTPRGGNAHRERATGGIYGQRP